MWAKVSELGIRKPVIVLELVTDCVTSRKTLELTVAHYLTVHHGKRSDHLKIPEC